MQSEHSEVAERRTLTSACRLTFSCQHGTPVETQFLKHFIRAAEAL